MGDFQDRLAALCAKELAAARRADDGERMAGIVTALSDLLGKTIAMAAKGDRTIADALLTGAEDMVARTAADWEDLGALASRLSKGGGPHG